MTSELEYLAGPHLGWIATIRPDGTLQVGPVVCRDNPVLGSVHATEYVRDEFTRAVAPFELPVTTARALLLRVDLAPVRCPAEHMSCDQCYITFTADDLEDRGLVTREPGPDRRVKVLTRTTVGATTRARFASAVAQRSPIMSRLSVADRATLDRLLSAILAGREN